MTDLSAPATFDLTDHPRGNGGFTPRLLRIELRRLLRDRRTLIFTLVFPVMMLLIVNSTIPEGQQSMGPHIVANVGAYIMVSMALYGVAMAASAGGAAIAVERASGWSRQLRISPLRPLSYIAMKVTCALMLGSLALVAAYVAGALLGVAHMPLVAWAASAAVILLGAAVFAAFGLLIGYLVPSENVTQVIGPLLAVLGFLGGLYQGPINTSTTMGQIQSLTPIYGLSQLAHWPLTLTDTGSWGTLDISWVLNLLVWGGLFVAGAVWRFKRDTGRV